MTHTSPEKYDSTGFIDETKGFCVGDRRDSQLTVRFPYLIYFQTGFVHLHKFRTSTSILRIFTRLFEEYFEIKSNRKMKVN